MFNFFKRKYLRETRRAIRQYNALFSSGQNRFLIDLLRNISKTQPNQKQSIQKVFLTPQSADNIDLTIIQYTLRRVKYQTLVRQVLLAINKSTPQPVSMAIPSHWAQYLKQQGIAVRPIVCAIKWHWMCFLFFGYGFLQFAKVLITRMPPDLKNVIKDNTKDGFDVFTELTPLNIPLENAEESRTIIDWFLRHYAPKSTVMMQVNQPYKRRLHDGFVFAWPQPLLPPSGLAQRMKFAGLVLSCAVVALFDLLRGRWATGLMFHELVMLFQFQCLSAAHQPTNVYCSNSGMFTRPLWTHLVSENDGKVCCYFYSTNNLQFLEPDKTRALSYGWELMNWPYYIVWNDLQKDYITSVWATAGVVDVVGSLWFQNSETHIPSKKKYDVVIFDVIPCRPNIYISLATPVEFYTHKNMSKIVSDVVHACEELGVHPSIKSKRATSSTHDKLYINFLKGLSAANRLRLIDPSTSAHHMIEHARVVIVAPFSSPAIIAESFGKPVVFFDPTNTIQLDDNAAAGIPIVSTVEELKAFIKTSLNNINQ